MPKTPPAMQALVEIAKLNPKQGDAGFIECPGCGGELRWKREAISGKLSGSCACGVRVPRS
jgi:hypothetical protein